MAYRFRPRHERGPFSFFGIAPGMSMRELNAELAARRATVFCREDFKNYQYCVVKLSPDPAFVAAMLDRHDRVVLVTAVSVQGLDGIGVQADSAQLAWSRVAGGMQAVPFAEFSDTGAVRWTSKNGRWTAELHYGGFHDPDVPSHVILTDSEGIALFAAQTTTMKDWATNAGWIPTTASSAIVARQRRRAERKSDYGTMATTLAALHDHEAGYWNLNHTYTRDLAGMFIIGGTRLRVLTANDSGWTADATHPEFPGRSCVTYGGRVPAHDWPVTQAGTAITSAEGVACDPEP